MLFSLFPRYLLFLLFLSLFFEGCSTQHFILKQPKQGEKSYLLMDRMIHQVRLEIEGKTQLFQGVFLLKNEEFFLLAHQGPMKLFGAISFAGQRGGLFYFPPMKKTIHLVNLLDDLGGIYLSKCPQKTQPSQKLICKKGSSSIKEFFQKGHLSKRIISNCRGILRITFKDYRLFVGHQLPSRIILERKGSYRLSILLVAFQPNIRIKKTLFEKMKISYLWQRCSK